MTPDAFIPFALPDIGEAEIDAVVEALRSGWLTTGPRVTRFEHEFADALGAGVHAVALNSATAGLHLAMEGLGIGPGDEVIVPTWTFTASAEVVRYVGADPVLVDVEPHTLLLDLEAAESAVTSRTRAVVPVHFAGLPVDRDAIAAFARRHGIAVVEDAAHAFPCTSSGLPVGTGASEAVVFSFYATKTMTTGEGGMAVTNDPALAARMRTMRLHGINRDVFDRYRSNAPAWRYEVVAPGFKYNLTDPAAAMGRVQLRRAGAMRERRAGIAAQYSSDLRDLPLLLPPEAGPGSEHAWHLFVVQIDAAAPLGRDDFIAGMAERGVGCSVHFIPLHQQPVWQQLGGLRDGAFPVASAAIGRVVSLPIFSSMGDEHVERVVAAARQLLGPAPTL